MNSIRQIVLGLGVLAGCAGGFAQDAGSRHAAATNHLKQLAAAMTGQCLTHIRSAADWQRERPERRRQLADMLGLDPLPGRTPLRAEVTGTLEQPAFRIEKLVFQSRPGLYVTGNFYVPKDVDVSRPA
ncbi:MAG: hypothetical protein KIT22_19960, partial [Verrucomicrobiae bacterium]|nr:hypothetical protein [Verrucomicrobiae bacterium]